MTGRWRYQHYGEETLATLLEINGRASIDRFVPSEHRGESLLPFLVARIRVAGRIADLGFLNGLLMGTKSVSFGGGSGKIDADLWLKRAVVEPKSRLVTEEASYSVDYLGYRAEGTGRILGFRADDLSGGGHIRLGEGFVALTGLEVDGGKAHVRGDICIEGGDLRGLFHAKCGILAVAADLHDKKETLHITSPKKWYERNRESFTCGQ